MSCRGILSACHHEGQFEGGTLINVLVSRITIMDDHTIRHCMRAYERMTSGTTEPFHEAKDDVTSLLGEPMKREVLTLGK